MDRDDKLYVEAAAWVALGPPVSDEEIAGEWADILYKAMQAERKEIERLRDELYAIYRLRDIWRTVAEDEKRKKDEWRRQWVKLNDCFKEADEFRDTILGRITDFRDTDPEEGESWERWYYAAFDLLKEEVWKQFATQAIRPAQLLSIEKSEDGNAQDPASA